MDPQRSSRVSAWVRDAALIAQERIVDPLRGRRPCPLLATLLDDPSLDAGALRCDLDRIVETAVGRRFTRRVVGRHPTRQSLTDVFDRGASQAAHVLEHVQSGDTLLEYGGGIGRLGRAIAPHVRRLVSVDVDPVMKKYGARLAPGVDFRMVDEVPGEEAFDGAYSIAVFFHLSLAEQRRALEYVHERLTPGGWFLVDLLTGPQTTGVQSANGDVRTTGLDDFRELYDPWFTARRVPLFNTGFLLRKKSHQAPATTAASGRWAVNEASVVFDVLEGEVVVVNLDNGAYYILEGTASAIWQMVAAGRSVPEIVEIMARHYPEASAGMSNAVGEFVAQLTGESLLVPATGAESLAPSFDERQLGPAVLPFAAPAMFRYTDMQALIQMDPIREYDETGWPRRPAFPPSRTP